MADQTQTNGGEQAGGAESAPQEAVVDAAAMAGQALEGAGKAAETIAAEAGAPAASGSAPGSAPGSDPRPMELPELGVPAAGAGNEGLSLLSDVNLNVKVELGRTRMYVEDVLRLSADSVIELDKAAGDPVDIYVNERYVAKGEVLVVNDMFCVRVSEIIPQSMRDD